MKRIIAALTAVTILALTAFLTSCSDGPTDLDEYDDLEQFVTIGKYINVEITPTFISVDDDMVDAEVQKWLATFSGETKTLTSTDEIASGDTLNIEFEGYINGENEYYEDGYMFTSTNGTESTVTIGSGGMIPGFEEALIGYHPGEKVEFDIKFPAEYSRNPKLSNAETRFRVTINSGTRPVLPEYTDEFVAENTEYKTIEEYENSIYDELRAEADEDQLIADISSVWNYVMSNSKVIKYPEGVVKAEVDSALDQYEQYASSKGMTLEEYVASENGTMEEFTSAIEKDCRNLVFEQMVLKIIIKRENIVLSDSDYETGSAEYAETYGFPDVKTLEEVYGVDVIRDSLLWDKVLLFLVDNAKVVESPAE